MKKCCSAVASVILGVSFGRGCDRWEQGGCINQGSCKQGQEREPDPCIGLGWRWEQGIYSGFTRGFGASCLVFLKVLGQAVPLLLPLTPHCLTGWLGYPGPHVPDPSPVTVPLSPGRRGGGCGC